MKKESQGNRRCIKGLGTKTVKLKTEKEREKERMNKKKIAKMSKTANGESKQ